MSVDAGEISTDWISLLLCIIPRATAFEVVGMGLRTVKDPQPGTASM